MAKEQLIEDLQDDLFFHGYINQETIVEIDEKLFLYVDITIKKDGIKVFELNYNEKTNNIETKGKIELDDLEYILDQINEAKERVRNEL